MRVTPWKKQVQQVKFDRNGTVWTSEGNTGEWWFDVGGLYWVSNEAECTSDFEYNTYELLAVPITPRSTIHQASG